MGNNKHHSEVIMVFLWLVSSEAKFLMVELLQPTCSVLGILEWDTGEVIFTDVRKKEQPTWGSCCHPHLTPVLKGTPLPGGAELPLHQALAMGSLQPRQEAGGCVVIVFCFLLKQQGVRHIDQQFLQKSRHYSRRH